jgi:hypothetical protein
LTTLSAVKVFEGVDELFEEEIEEGTPIEGLL